MRCPYLYRKLYHSLEAAILAIIEATGALKASAEYELYQRTGAQPEILEAVIGQ